MLLAIWISSVKNAVHIHLTSLIICSEMYILWVFLAETTTEAVLNNSPGFYMSVTKHYRCVVGIKIKKSEYEDGCED